MRISRRTYFQLSAGGMATWLANLQFAQQNADAGQKSSIASVKSVIMIFNCGGPSHIDLWDPKPDASDEVRGEFSPIETSVPGIVISESIPELARQVHRLAIVRSVHHSHSAHNSGMHWSIVGRPYRMDSTLINPSPTDYPSLGTLVGWLAQRDGYSGSVPPYVITPYPHCDSTVYITPGQYGGCLGVQFDPFVLEGDPNTPDFRVRNLALHENLSTQRLESRLGLRQQLDSSGRPIAHAEIDDLDIHRSQATRMVATGNAARAFNLSLEPAAVRDRYGRHSWGQSHLLARRLIESGVRFVSTVNGRSIIWDTHKDNFPRMKNNLVPPMQQAYCALLDDLSERGLLDTTLVLWIGDFGRTPRINKDAGRDHWPQCFSVVLAGGGIRGGQVIGASDRIGAYPRERPVTPADLHASIFHLLGYDSQAITYNTVDGRPTFLSEGHFIKELV